MPPNPPYTKTRRNARHAGPDAPIGPCTSRITQRAEIPRRGGPQSRPPKPTPPRGEGGTAKPCRMRGVLPPASAEGAGLGLAPTLRRKSRNCGRGQAPPLQRTEGELCTIQGPITHRAAHPDGAGHRSPCSTETRPRSPSYPSPQNCQQGEGSRPPPASLFPITWACRCTAGHSTTDGSA